MVFTKINGYHKRKSSAGQPCTRSVALSGNIYAYTVNLSVAFLRGYFIECFKKGSRTLNSAQFTTLGLFVLDTRDRYLDTYGRVQGAKFLFHLHVY
jgi:hypothetical protein